MLLQSVVAALLGTVAMTLSSTTEMPWRERPPSVVPGKAANKLLQLVGVPELKGRTLDLLATWTHWIYGTAWGVLFWVLIDPLGLSIVPAGVVFFSVVWLTEQLELPLIGIGVPWPWKWGLRENLIDAWHHLVYATGTTAAFLLLGGL